MAKTMDNNEQPSDSLENLSDDALGTTLERKESLVDRIRGTARELHDSLKPKAQAKLEELEREAEERLNEAVEAMNIGLQKAGVIGKRLWDEKVLPAIKQGEESGGKLLGEMKGDIAQRIEDAKNNRETARARAIEQAEKRDEEQKSIEELRAKVKETQEGPVNPQNILSVYNALGSAEQDTLARAVLRTHKTFEKNVFDLDEWKEFPQSWEGKEPVTEPTFYLHVHTNAKTKKLTGEATILCETPDGVIAGTVVKINSEGQIKLYPSTDRVNILTSINEIALSEKTRASDSIQQSRREHIISSLLEGERAERINKYVQDYDEIRKTRIADIETQRARRLINRNEGQAEELKTDKFYVYALTYAQRYDPHAVGRLQELEQQVEAGMRNRTARMHQKHMRAPRKSAGSEPGEDLLEETTESPSSASPEKVAPLHSEAAREAEAYVDAIISLAAPIYDEPKDRFYTGLKNLRKLTEEELVTWADYVSEYFFPENPSKYVGGILANLKRFRVNNPAQIDGEKEQNAQASPATAETNPEPSGITEEAVDLYDDTESSENGKPLSKNQRNKFGNSGRKGGRKRRSRFEEDEEE